MKSHYALALVLGYFSFTASAQNNSRPYLPIGHYVVVASYLEGQESYAQRYSAKLNEEGKHANYGFDDSRKFYHVYLDKYDDFNESIRQMLKTRESGFPTAWVRVLKTSPAVAAEKVVETKKQETVVEQPAKKDATVVTPQVVPKPEETKKPDSAIVAQQFKPSILTIDSAIDNPPADPVYRPQVLKNTPVFLSMYNPTDNTLVDGEIEVIDADRAKLIKKVKGNEYLALPDPDNNTGKLTLISSAFGYRKVQHEINYKSTEKDTLQPYISLVGNYYVIHFDMVWLHKGDIEILYNVYFYNDAAIMLPESKYELNGLLQMMKQNPAHKIVLHGHTNSRSAGKLITRGESNNFFELSGDVKTGVGSAKDLSRERAQIIKDWLIMNGIVADRMEIKAWGGSRMIHDKNSAHARKNVRVEVEVVEE